jgi:hypothetical protein
VIVNPLCQTPPGLAADIAVSSEPTLVRGALVQEFSDGHFIVWTQNVAVTVFGPDESAMRAMIEALQPLNPVASLVRAGLLHPPEPLVCPQLDPDPAGS